MPGSARYLGVDVGGTTIKAVRVDGDGRVLAEARASTPRSPVTGAALVAAVADAVDALGGHADDPLGVVVPGVVDDERGLAVRSVNLGWSDLPLGALLACRWGRPVAFGQDVRAGGVAETTWGAARDAAGIVGFLPIGTGIGMSLHRDTHPLLQAGWAGEIGQVVIARGPHRGHRVEEISSGIAVARRFGVDDATQVLRARAAGDPRAAEAWESAIAVLADALAPVLATVPLSTLIIGGGIAAAGDALMDTLHRALAERLGGVPAPILVSAALGDLAGAIGAAAMARGLTP